MSDLEEYILNYITPEDPVLYALRRQTHLRLVQPQMVSGHLQGRWLRMLVEMTRPRHILELGTFTGYSAIALAQGFTPGEPGMLHTVDCNDEQRELAAEFIAKAGLTNRIVQYHGSALELVPQRFRNQPFDLIFIDADKREYPDYYRMLLDNGHGLVRPGTWIVADNTLWSGKVVDVAANDKQTEGIRAFNDLLRDDERVEQVILPLRDGMTIARVKRI